ncbi:MAG: hypothetical protein HONBIEJF_01873 [Fimbriimonadaceae bacterium]|nr:hypothetical protein [Fimbriimonadaceae bacterium]
MKRRKPPYMLIVALFVLVGAAVWFNVPDLHREDPIVDPTAGHEHGPGDGHNHDEPVADASKPDATKESMKEVLQKATGADRKPEPPTTENATPRQVPTAAKTKPEPPEMLGKPKPNMQTTSTQWWDDKSMMGDKLKKSKR